MEQHSIQCKQPNKIRIMTGKFMQYWYTNKMNEVLTKHFDIEPHTTYFEIMMPNRKYIYYEFNNDHTIRMKTIFNFNTLQFE